MKTTKKERRIPEGWRTLTPTEVITKECRWSYKEKLPFVNPDAWSEAWDKDVGRTMKQLKANVEQPHEARILFIKPITLKSNEQPTTPITQQESSPSSTPATT